MTDGVTTTAPEALSAELRRLGSWVGTAAPREVTAESVAQFRSALREARPTGEENTAGAGAGMTVPLTYFCPDPVAEAQNMGLVRPTEPTHSIDGGSEWTLIRPVHVGDILTSVGQVVDVTRRLTHDGRPLVRTTLEIRAWNQDGALVGVATGVIVNVEPPSTRDRRSGVSRPQEPEPGATVPSFTIERTTMDDIVRWTAATGDFSPVHYDSTVAEERGFAGPLVNGPWKSAMLIQMLTRWLGDRGRIEHVRCRYVRADVVGDRLTLSGQVRKSLDGEDESRLECDLWVEDATGCPTVTGSATVRMEANLAQSTRRLPIEELKEALGVGRVTHEFTYRVDPNDVARFRAAVAGGNQPAQGTTPSPGQTAPPTYYAALDPVERRDLLLERALDVVPFRKVGGGNAFNEVVSERPLVAGDHITVRTSYEDVYERPGRSGRLLFRVRINELRDSSGSLVATTRMGHVLAYDMEATA
jgi:acyl dehydratase